MFNRKTLLIVGAGAGADIGMPIGSDLVDAIANSAATHEDRMSPRGDDSVPKIRQALLRTYNGDARRERIQSLQSLSRRVRLSGSIDRFLDENSHDPVLVELGKASIITEIALAEGGSNLAQHFGPDRQHVLVDHEALRRSWYYKFARLWLQEIKTPDAIDRAHENLSIVCFNYDRCLELFLASFVRQKYQLTQSDAEGIVERLGIIHPYGTIGPIDAGGHDRIGFGEDPLLVQPFHRVARISTFTEEQRDPKVKTAIAAAMTSAEQIMFLGFSCESTNMQLLSLPPRGDRLDHRRVFATVFRVHAPQVPRIQSAIAGALRLSGSAADNIVLANLSCPDFMDQFGPLLLA